MPVTIVDLTHSNKPSYSFTSKNVVTCYTYEEGRPISPKKCLKKGRTFFEKNGWLVTFLLKCLILLKILKT